MGFMRKVKIPKIELPSDRDEAPETPAPSEKPVTPKRSLPAPSLASCWWGKSAEQRGMNILSLSMPDATVETYLQRMRDAGCNTVHLIVSNLRDGEHGGYSIYGNKYPGSKPYEQAMDHMEKRLQRCLNVGLVPVLWMHTDDSTSWTKAVPDAAHEDYYHHAHRLYRYAAAVCLGLELDEYFDGERVRLLVAHLRQASGLSVWTHQKPGRFDYGKHGDGIMLQVNPGALPSTIKSAVSKARATGKPVIAHELARFPDRTACLAALDAGAVGVGNW